MYSVLILHIPVHNQDDQAYSRTGRDKIQDDMPGKSSSAVGGRCHMQLQEKLQSSRVIKHLHLGRRSSAVVCLLVQLPAPSPQLTRLICGWHILCGCFLELFNQC